LCARARPPRASDTRPAAQHVLLYNVKGVTYNDYLQPLEKAEMVREGSHCTILTYSRMRCAHSPRARITRPASHHDVLTLPPHAAGTWWSRPSRRRWRQATTRR
jgi:hypothetical protein